MNECLLSRVILSRDSQGMRESLRNYSCLTARKRAFVTRRGFLEVEPRPVTCPTA